MSNESNELIILLDFVEVEPDFFKGVNWANFSRGEVVYTQDCDDIIFDFCEFRRARSTFIDLRTFTYLESYFIREHDLKSRKDLEPYLESSPLYAPSRGETGMSYPDFIKHTLSDEFRVQRFSSL